VRHYPPRSFFEVFLPLDQGSIKKGLKRSFWGQKGHSKPYFTFFFERMYYQVSMLAWSDPVSQNLKWFEKDEIIDI